MTLPKFLFAIAASAGLLGLVHCASEAGDVDARTSVETSSNATQAAPPAWEICTSNADCRNGEICCPLCAAADLKCIQPTSTGRCPKVPCLD